MSSKRCLPLSVKLKLLDDQEKGFGPKALMKKYKIKKSTYYRILGEKEVLKNFPRGDAYDVKHKIETDDDDDKDNNSIANGENSDSIQENEPDENRDEMHCDPAESQEDVNEAMLQWYSEQEAEGVEVGSADIDEAAERLAQQLGFTHFKHNSSGWPLRFRKPQDAVSTPPRENENDGEDESPGVKVKKVLRIQDQITAYQRLQAGESAQQIGNDLGVSKATILSVKKKLKDTLFSPSLNPNYQISVERLKTKKKSENAVKDKFSSVQKIKKENMAECDYDNHKDAVWAAIERRKRLMCSKNGLSNKARGLSYHEKIEAIAQFKEGITVKQIARNFCVSTSTIQRVKKKFSKSHKLVLKNYMRLEQKVNVLERLDEGETITEIAEDLGVHESTIRSIKKTRLKIMNVYKASLTSLGTSPSNSPKSSINEKIEKRLLVWINDLKRRKIPMSGAMIQKKALMIQMNLSQEEGSSSSSQTFMPTKDWLNRFKKRHNMEKLLHEDSESASESDSLKPHKAGPKSSKKKHITGPSRSRAAAKTSKLTTPVPHKESMTLSKLAEGLREMYLNRDLPEDLYRCNAFTPRVSLVRQEHEPNIDKKYTIMEDVKTEPQSDEETWLTAHTNAGTDSDWGEDNCDTNSFTEVSDKSKDNLRKKRKKTNSEHSRKRRRLSGIDNSDDDRSVVDYNGGNFIDFPIKQEPQTSLDSIPSNVPMAVLPAGSTYVPPLPMFQMPTTGLTVYMPESQQMMMQHPMNYPHGNSSELFMNQQQIRGRTIANSTSGQFSDMHGEVSVEPNIGQENENVIMMPFGRDLCEQEKSRQLTSPDANSVVCDSPSDTSRKSRAAAIAENIGIGVAGSSHKQLRDLTFKLLELNNKNLICDERIEKAREEYEKTVSLIDAEKKMNDQEIDQVLAAIQEWKKAKSQSGT